MSNKKRSFKKPSYYHNNRKFYNWRLYDIGDSFLEEYSREFKGDMYDLGCGDKPYEEFFLQFCDNYIGVDWSFSRHNNKADIVADLNIPLPINDNVADTIICLSVLEHIKEPQILLSESNRILRENGTFILSVPFMWHVHEIPHDYYRFTEFGLRYLFEKSGFKEIQITPSTGFWINWFTKLNYQLLELINGNYYKNKILKLFVYPMAHLNQYLGIFMDKIWYHEEKETQGYWVIAKKE